MCNFFMFPSTHYSFVPAHGCWAFQGIERPFQSQSGQKNETKKKDSSHDFGQIFTPSWIKAASQSNIIGGFVGSGIWPLDRSKNRPERLIGSLVPNNISPGPSSSGNSSESLCTSPVVDAIRELFAPVDVDLSSGARKSRAVTKTRCLTLDEFLAELVVKRKPREAKAAKGIKHKRDVEIVPGSDAEDDPEKISVAAEDLATPCGECERMFDSDVNGENWFSCCACKVWYHLTCQGFSNASKRKQIVCNDCK